MSDEEDNNLEEEQLGDPAGHLYVVRHGERIDMVDQTWEKTAAEPDDPPLTERGILQARKTGQKLRTEPHKIEHIFCSPFLRCLQTATEIAEELDLQIKVEYGLSEWFKKSWFTKMPALDLNVIQSAFSRVDKSYKSFYELKNFPESLTECCLRFEKTTLNLITNFMEKDKNILLGKASAF
eukprot:TRINITY_DN1196_c0_g1_i1.p1 TRINITY_DN1196_c0_g1~~TRINITY_DN1196_c0_g1_i1.p1  ORF type:complete len:181 (-),score=25.41 TRINITY_DN1196_c0_g1_i1:266-808(-)